MAIAFVTSGAIGQSGFPSSPRTFSSVACGSDANTCVIGWEITNSGDVNSITGMTVGGSAATARTGVSWGSNDNLRFFSWVGSNPGTCDIAFTHTGSASIIERGYVVYSGVSAVANITETLGGSGTTTPSVTVTSATGDVALMIYVHDNTTPTVSSSGGTTRLDTAGSFARHTVTEEPGAASVVVNATMSGTTYGVVKWGLSLTAAAASDTTPPTLSSPSGTGGLGVCSGSVSTNEGNGTLYAVATASSTAPSSAQVKAGQDHTGSAALRVVSQAVSGTGTQTVASGSISGGAGARYLHFMHEDAATNQSTVATSAGFSVTAAATSMTVALKQSDGTTAAASITGIHWAVLNAATLGAATSILAHGSSESTDGSGNLVLDITGLGLVGGDVRYVVAGKSNGTVGADFDGWHGPAAAA